MTQADTRIKPRPARVRARRAPLLLAITMAAAFALSACGGGSSSSRRTGSMPSSSSGSSTTRSASSGLNGPTTEQITPTTGAAAPGANQGNTAAECDSLTTCYTPRQLEMAYGIAPLLARGIDGRGETVILPEIAEGLFPASQYSDLRRDMALFDKVFGLPAPKLRLVNSIARSSSPWQADGEGVLDAEMIHTAAPGAAITIVLLKPSSFTDAQAGVAAAVAALRLVTSRPASVVSISAAGQTGGENCDTPSEVKLLNSSLQDAIAHHVTIVAASGDIGAVGEPCHLAEGLTGGSFPPIKEVNLPASDPLVLAAGGTTLTASHQTGRYISEIGWGSPYGSPGSQFQASGGGFSRVFARPSYQNGLPGARAGRGVPDVASDAAPHTGMALIVATSTNGYTIRNSGGTSAAAPLWAGVIALADQYAHRRLGFVNPAIYHIGETSTRAFHDVPTGDNSVSFPPHTITGYRATRGWNPVAGWGSPNASVLVPLLARDVTP